MEKTLNRRIHDFSKTTDILQTIIIYLIALIVPTFLGATIKNIFGVTSIVTTNSQLIVGSIVNTALIITAINLKGWNKIIGVITMPSISTILSGYVFQTASPYLVWMIPAIWLGNFALVYAYKFFMLSKKTNYFLAGIIGITVKVLVIALGFAIVRSFGIFPEKMVSNLQIAMTTTQVITATIGACISYAIYFTEKKLLDK